MTETKDWQRARRPEQKEERSAAILNAAAVLLDARGINGTSLNAIARAVGLSKANLYRYFESREAMLLELMLREQAAWADELSELLEPLAGKDDLDEFVAKLKLLGFDCRKVDRSNKMFVLMDLKKKCPKQMLV